MNIKNMSVIFTEHKKHSILMLNKLPEKQHRQSIFTYSLFWSEALSVSFYDKITNNFLGVSAVYCVCPSWKKLFIDKT